MDLIYTHFSGGKIYQSGASSIPGTPENWHYRWYKPGHYSDEKRKNIHDNIISELKSFRIDILVLASEYQPILQDSSLKIVSLPFEDAFDLSPAKTTQLVELLRPFCKLLAKALVDGKNILSTCWAGKNRSSLITGLTLKLLLNQNGFPLMSGVQIVDLIQKNKDKNCLCNPIFRDLVLYNTWEQ